MYLYQNITCGVNLYITSVVSPYQLLALFISICYTFKRFYTKIIVWQFPSFQWAVQKKRCWPEKEIPVHVTCVVYLYRWAICYLCCIPVQVSPMLPVLYTCTGEPYVTCVVYLYRWALCYMYLCCIPEQVSHMLPVLYNCMCYRPDEPYITYVVYCMLYLCCITVCVTVL